MTPWWVSLSAAGGTIWPIATYTTLPFPSLSLNEGPPRRYLGPQFLFRHDGGSR